MKMPREIKLAWISALKSGEYAQGRGALYNKTTKKHCCLGVLCELAIKEKITKIYSENADGEVWYGSSDVLPRASELPADVQEWAGIDALGNVNSIGSSLAGLNDAGHSFHEIAKIIERYL